MFKILQDGKELYSSPVNVTYPAFRIIKSDQVIDKTNPMVTIGVPNETLTGLVKIGK